MGQTIIFLPCYFYLLPFIFFSSPNLSGQRLDVYQYHTSTQVRPYCEFRMHVWNVLYAARWKYKTQKIAILAPSHNFVGLSQLRHVSKIKKC